MANLLGDLTNLEKKLIEEQKIITVRGKHGSPVPIIIPKDTIPLMELIADKQNREICGVTDEVFLFATTGALFWVLTRFSWQ